MYDIYAYLELVREYCTMRKPFCVNGIGLLLYQTSSGQKIYSVCPADLLAATFLLFNVNSTIICGDYYGKQECCNQKVKATKQGDYRVDARFW